MKPNSNDKRDRSGPDGPEKSIGCPADGKNAVVVSNNSDKRSALSRRLVNFGLQAFGFQSVPEAMQWMAHQNPPSLVLADVDSPDIDPSSFRRLLQDHIYPKSQPTPFIGVSIDLSDEAGSDLENLPDSHTFISLPHKEELFKSAVRAILCGEPWPRPKRLLAAGINPAQLSALKKPLVRIGWELFSSDTGSGLLDLATAHHPDFILLDAPIVQTPDDSVLEALSAAYPSAIILIAIRMQDQESSLRWLQKGAAACVRKPWKPQQIVNLCEQIPAERSALGMLRRIKERNRELIKLETRCQTLSHAVTGGFALFEAVDEGSGQTTDYRCIEVNAACESLTGFPRERIVGRFINELISEGFHPLSTVFTEVDDSGKAVTYERFIPKTARYLEGHAFTPQPGQFAIAFHDITARKKAEARYLRAQRMECIGSLASGVAHDLNNVLAAIVMAATLLKEFPDGPDVPTLLKTINSSAVRGSAIVKQLLTFGRGTEIERLNIKPGLVLEEIAQLARDTFPRDIEVSCEYPNDLWNIHANTTQIHQVLLNLCINARDSMPNGGTIKIAAENRSLDREFGAQHSVEPGSFVAIKIRDTGTGMPPEIVAKIFDPYFTTKEPGKGTGLGLPTVLDIVKSHQGCLTLETNPGQGTEFTVFFPAMNPALPNPVRGGLAKDRTALVVDSDPESRDLLRKALEIQGYRVLVSRNGTHALALHVRHQAQIRFVLADLATRCLDREVAARAIRNLDSRVPIVVTGPARSHEKTAQSLGINPLGFLLKPFHPDELNKVLNELPTV